MKEVVHLEQNRSQRCKHFRAHLLKPDNDAKHLSPVGISVHGIASPSSTCARSPIGDTGKDQK